MSENAPKTEGFRLWWPTFALVAFLGGASFNLLHPLASARQNFTWYIVLAFIICGIIPCIVFIDGHLGESRFRSRWHYHTTWLVTGTASYVVGALVTDWLVSLVT